MWDKYQPEPICKFCGGEMEIDDVDYNFPGNQNELWICRTCLSSLWRKIRYKKVLLLSYQWQKSDY